MMQQKYKKNNHGHKSMYIFMYEVFFNPILQVIFHVDLI